MTDRNLPADEVMAEMASRFTSLNGVPVERAMIRVAEWAVLVERLQWRPIESAPTEGYILLWFPALGYPVVGLTDTYGYKSGSWKASHWMPVPSAPTRRDEP